MSNNANVEPNKKRGKSNPSPVVAAAALSALEHMSPDRLELIDLNRLLEDAIEAHRSGALKRDVRLVCCLLDNIDVLGREREIVQRLDAMLGAAIDAAIPGTRMECNVSPERNGVVMRLRFLRPASRAVCGITEMVGGEIVACWPQVEIH